YNSAGQLLSVTQPAAQTGGTRPVTAMENYNSCNKPERIIDPEGVTQLFGYDTSCNLLTSTLVGDGGAHYTTTYGYDAVGNRTSAQDPETGSITTFEYDDNRNLIRTDKVASADSAHS